MPKTSRTALLKRLAAVDHHQPCAGRVESALDEIRQERRELAGAAARPEGAGCGRRLLTFFDFPAEHWKHLRTTNPIESTFATVKLRTKVT